MRLACFGLPLAPLLLAADGHEVVLALLAPVASVGARRLARRIGAERVLRVDRAGAFVHEVTTRLSARPPDLIVSWFWTRRLPSEWIAQGRLGGIGVHPSLLPRHRGPNPYFWAIDAGDALTGVSVHRLTEDYDRGELLDVRTLPVGERNSWQLARALDRPSLQALRDTVRRLARGPLRAQPQDEAAATWAPEPEAGALRADFHWPTTRVLRRVRALAPVPGLALEIRGVRCFVTAAEPSSEVPAALLPGEAGASREEPRRVLVRTGDGAIALTAALVRDDGESSEESPVNGETLARLVFGPK